MTRSSLGELLAGISRRTLVVVAVVAMLVMGAVAVTATSGGAPWSGGAPADAAPSSAPRAAADGGSTSDDEDDDAEDGEDDEDDDEAPDRDDGLGDDEIGDDEYLSYDEDDDEDDDGGANNIVIVHNESDGTFRMRSSVQLNRIDGDRVTSVNYARAYGSCVECHTFAVALQINLVERGASDVRPENRAEAINFECTRCFTYARALQYTYTVDDPYAAAPPEVRRLVRQMERELRAIARAGARGEITYWEAFQQVRAIERRFTELAESLDAESAQADETTTEGAVEETPAPTGSPSAEPSPSPSPSASAASSGASPAPASSP